MSRTLTDLREKLFDTLEALSDRENPMDLARAKMIANVAQVLINSATVEVKHNRATDGRGTGFIPDADAPKALPHPGNGEAKDGRPPRLTDLPARKHVMR